MKTISILKTELRSNLIWNVAWLVTLGAFLLLLIGIYPGDTAMKQLTPLLQTASVEDLLGYFGTASPGYPLWISFMIPFMTIILLIFAMTTGVRSAVQSISDGTGELFYTLPVSRIKFLIMRIIANFIPLVFYFLIQLIIFSIPIDGHTIPIDYLLNIGWWGSLFCLFGLLFGILFGLLAGNSSNGHHYSIIVILLLFALQIVARVSTSLSNLNDFNPLTYYQPEQYLLGKGFVKNGILFGITYYYYPVLLFLLCIVFFIICLFEFNHKDLSNDAGFHLNIIKRIRLSINEEFNEKNLQNYVILSYFLFPFRIISHILGFIKGIFFPKNVRNNPFVFWARIFERYMPVTADFIYSDNMLLFIGFLGVIMFFPLQFLVYPGDNTMLQTSAGFSSGLFLVFTYGHNLLTNPNNVFLWYIMSNSIGVVWIFLIPMSFFWVRKAIRNDGNSGTGEILGGLPLNSKNVIFQRIFAIFVELVFIIILMVFWLLVSEALINESYNQEWEIISLFSMIPLYMFLIIFSSLIALLFKQKGGLFSGIFLFGVVISFIISILNSQFDQWYFRGIFDLYDPVLIIQNQSLLANNDGLVSLLILALVSLMILFITSAKFTWLNITNKSKSPST